jgi:hypothetical protein
LRPDRRTCSNDDKRASPGDSAAHAAHEWTLVSSAADPCAAVPPGVAKPWVIVTAAASCIHE